MSGKKKAEIIVEAKIELFLAYSVINDHLLLSSDIFPSHEQVLGAQKRQERVKKRGDADLHSNGILERKALH